MAVVFVTQRAGLNDIVTLSNISMLYLGRSGRYTARKNDDISMLYVGRSGRYTARKNDDISMLYVGRSGRYTARKNDNISMLYVIYQAVLFGSSILGPATIFLLVVGAVDAVFQIGLGVAVAFGLIPLVAFLIVCYKCKNDTQVSHNIKSTTI